MPSPSRSIRNGAVLLLGLLLAPAFPLHATCGGGGGGGVGGINPNLGGGGAPQVYQVPWKLADKELPASGGWTLYWFPLSPDEVKGSGLQTSRTLALSASRCIAMGVVPADVASLHTKLKAPSDQPQIVLLAADGSELGRVAGSGKVLDVKAVEKLVDSQLKQGESAVEAQAEEAKKKAEGGDKEGAVQLYQKVWEQRCLFPKPGKKAGKALKKLGVEVQDARFLRENDLPPSILSGPASAEIERTMEAGLAAEIAARYPESAALYEKASRLDPADPTPLRFLAEVYRHHIGDWDKARQIFQQVLDMPADPLARAVALHGLGKMTIHAGEFQKGLGMFEESVATYPLALTYRNLAVYWFSERQKEKAAGYVEKALALEPHDSFNQIFSAVYLAVAGRREEAEKVARENEGTLSASYNLAAIWAQLGNPEKALDLLRRHFFTFEQYDAVRAHEMKEAREDYVFVTLHDRPEFIEMTKLAAQSPSMHK